MAMGAIELATIARSQDYSNIRHNETTKVMTEQNNIVVREHKETMQKTRQVRDGENSDWYNRKFDAKEKGGNQYSGDGGKKKDDPENRDKVVLKGQGGFDVKI